MDNIVELRGIYGCEWNLWVWLVGMVVKRLLIPTPLVFALFGSIIPTFCSFCKRFFVLVYTGIILGAIFKYLIIIYRFGD